MSDDNNSTASSQLFEAAKAGDIGGFEAAIRAGADKNARDPNFRNYTALHWSAQYGHKNVVLKLLNAGVNVDERDDNGISALHICCIFGNESIALMLMVAGAEVDATCNKGITPLMYASIDGHDNVVKCLIDGAGADADYKNSFGCSAIYWASRTGQSSVINVLAQLGADVNIKGSKGQHPLHCAAYKGNDDTVSTLIQLGAHVNSTDDQNNTPLHLASRKGHVNIVERLLRNGADINYSDILGKSPLYKASERGHVDVVETLLQNGAHTSIPSQCTAVINGHLNILKKLMPVFSDIDATIGHDQNTLLHLAVQNNKNNIVEWLILKGANPYTCNAEGYSAIQHALDKDNRELVSFMASRNLHVPRGSLSTSLEEANNHNCAVCLDLRTTTVLTLPCRHAKTCKNCMDHLQANNDNQCPICRAEIISRIPIYC